MNHNIPIDNLIEIALNNKEGITASNGALIVTTGKRTGRSPKDRFIVEDSITREVVDWSNRQIHRSGVVRSCRHRRRI